MKDKQYTGRLDPKSAAQGIKFAYENANALLEDAQLLFEHKRFERCVSLSILAIEESGKSTIIRGLLLADEPTAIKKEWKNYRRHTEKNLAWILPELVHKGARRLDELSKVFDPNSDHGQTLDNLKQLSFYTDIFSSKKWSSPKEIIDENIAKHILSIAENMVKIEKVMTSEKELELWIKHLKPAKNLGMMKMKEALKNCYLEAASKGLIDKSKLPELTQFLE